MLLTLREKSSPESVFERGSPASDCATQTNHWTKLELFYYDYSGWGSRKRHGRTASALLNY